MRLSNSQTLKEVLEDYVKVFKFADKLDAYKLTECWETLMGKDIASRTTKLEIRKKILYVVVDSAALRSELSYAKTKIMLAVNKQFNKEIVNEIVII